MQGLLHLRRLFGMKRSSKLFMRVQAVWKLKVDSSSISSHGVDQQRYLLKIHINSILVDNHSSAAILKAKSCCRLSGSIGSETCTFACRAYDPQIIYSSCILILNFLFQNLKIDQSELTLFVAHKTRKSGTLGEPLAVSLVVFRKCDEKNNFLRI